MGDKNLPRERKTLIQLQAENTVRDPAAHAKRQVSELDKTAKRSQAKRKSVTEQMEANKKELAHINHQIDQLRSRYDPLCEHLEETKKKREVILQTLASCREEEKKIMGLTQSIVFARRIDDSKFQRKMASAQLELLRGFNMSPQSTFHQSRGHGGGTGEGTLPRLEKSTSRRK